MTPLSPEDYTEDRLLGGRLRLVQPGAGYRAAIDPVLLAAAVPAQAGEKALDLGTGSGAAALCLALRVPDLAVTGIEIDSEMAMLARHNAAINEMDQRFTVQEGDVSHAQGCFDHVFSNPPYHSSEHHQQAQSPTKARANAAPAAALAAFIETGLRRLKTGGTLTLIQKAERLADILFSLDRIAGRIIILPVAPFAERPATRVLIGAVKGRKTPLTLCAPLVLHQSDGTYRPEVEAILRAGAALDLAAYAAKQLSGRIKTG